MLLLLPQSHLRVWPGLTLIIIQDEYHVCVPGDEKGSVCSDPLAQGGYIVLGSMAYFFCHQATPHVEKYDRCMSRCMSSLGHARGMSGP